MTNDKEVSDTDIANVLIPLANLERIKIMRQLSKGSKYFNELLRATALTNSPLRFHLKILLDAAYIKQERPRGKYTLTSLGKKALKMAEELARTKNYTISMPELQFQLQELIRAEREKMILLETLM